MVMFKVQIEFYDDYAPTYQKYRRAFKSILRKTLKLLGYKRGEFLVEVTVTDEENIKVLNKEYREKDTSTDVLSFAFNDMKPGDTFNTNFVHLGSVIICAPIALKQAELYGHSDKREITFLFTHGLLHLLGYDHGNKEDEAIMISLQNKIIGKRGGAK